MLHPSLYLLLLVGDDIENGIKHFDANSLVFDTKLDQVSESSRLARRTPHDPKVNIPRESFGRGRSSAWQVRSERVVFGKSDLVKKGIVGLGIEQVGQEGRRQGGLVEGLGLGRVVVRVKGVDVSIG